MASICGTDCCQNCAQRKTCGGCEQTNGHPFGGSCTAAEAVRRAGPEELLRQKQALTAEFNALALPGLQVNDLNLLNGSYVNLAYPLPGGQAAQFLQDNRVYWGQPDRSPRQRALLRRRGRRDVPARVPLRLRRPGPGTGAVQKEIKRDPAIHWGAAAQFAPPLRVCLFAGVLLFSVPPGTCVVFCSGGGETCFLRVRL